MGKLIKYPGTDPAEPNRLILSCSYCYKRSFHVELRSNNPNDLRQAVCSECGKAFVFEVVRISTMQMILDKEVLMNKGKRRIWKLISIVLLTSWVVKIIFFL